MLILIWTVTKAIFVGIMTSAISLMIVGGMFIMAYGPENPYFRELAEWPIGAAKYGGFFLGFCGYVLYDSGMWDEFKEAWIRFCERRIFNDTKN